MFRFHEKISTVVLASFFILIPLAFLATKTVIYPHIHSVALFSPFKEAIARIITLILLVLILLPIVFSKKGIVKTPLYFPLTFILIYQGISLLWTKNRFQGIEYWLHWGSLFIFFFVCLNSLKDFSSARKWMKLSLVPAAIVCGISIFCSLFQVDLPFFQKREFFWSGTFGNYKFAGEYLTPLIFWAAALYFSENDKKILRFPTRGFAQDDRFSLRMTFSLKKLYLAFILLAIVSLLFVLKSRASIVSLVLLLPVVTWIIYRDSSRSFASLRTLGMTLGKHRFKAMILTSFCLFFVFLTISGKLYKYSGITNSHRQVIWKNTLQMVKDRPFTGVGIGNFNLIYPLYMSPEDRYLIPENVGWNDFVRQAHNEYLQWLSELGIFGIILYLVVFLLICKQLHEFLKKKNPETQPVLFLFLSFMCSCLIALFGFNFQNAETSFFAMATLAFLTQGITPPHQFFVISSTPLKVFLLLLTGLLILLSPKLLIRQFVANYYQLKGQSFLAIDDLRAVQIFERGQKWNPNDWETHFLIGKGYGDHQLFPQAIQHLKRSIELNPSYVSTFYNLGLYLEMSQKWDEATETYQRLLEIAPDYRKANLRLGTIALLRRQPDVARSYFQKILMPTAYQKKEMLEAYHQLALCSIEQRDYPRARKEIFEAFLLNQGLEEPLLKFLLNQN